MKACVLLFFVLYGGTFALKNCSTSLPEVCPGRYGVPIPGSSEELDELCSHLLPHLGCVQKYADECWTLEEAEDMQKDVKYAKDVCDKESKTHRDVIPYLSCIKEVAAMTAHECINMTKDFIENNKDQILPQNPDDDGNVEDAPVPKVCLGSIHLMTCFLSYFEVNCDPGVVDVIVDAYHRTSVSKDICGRQIEKQLLKIVDVLKTEFNTKYMVELLSSNFV